MIAFLNHGEPTLLRAIAKGLNYRNNYYNQSTTTIEETEEKLKMMLKSIVQNDNSKTYMRELFFITKNVKDSEGKLLVPMELFEEEKVLFEKHYKYVEDCLDHPYYKNSPALWNIISVLTLRLPSNVHMLPDIKFWTLTKHNEFGASYVFSSYLRLNADPNSNPSFKVFVAPERNSYIVTLPIGLACLKNGLNNTITFYFRHEAKEIETGLSMLKLSGAA